MITQPTFKNPPYPCLAMGSIGIEKRSAYSDSFGTESNSFDNICAAANAAINHDVDLVEEFWA